MKDPLLTVIVPVHNVAAYLNRSLTSIAAQTYQNLEVIIVDDDSDDRTGELSDQWADMHKNVRVLHLHQNMGISGARNAGLKIATGDYVTFTDGDDWCDPKLFEFYIQKIKQYKLDLVATGYYYSGKTEQPSGKTNSGDQLVKRGPLLHLVRKMNSPIRGYVWNKCYRLDVIRKYHLRFNQSITLMEDQVFNVEYILKTQRYLINTMPLYHYFQRPGSAIHNPSPKKGFNVVQAITIIQTSIWRQQLSEFKQGLGANHSAHHMTDLNKSLSKNNTEK